MKKITIYTTIPDYLNISSTILHLMTYSYMGQKEKDLVYKIQSTKRKTLHCLKHMLIGDVEISIGHLEFTLL